MQSKCNHRPRDDKDTFESTVDCTCICWRMAASQQGSAVRQETRWWPTRLPTFVLLACWTCSADRWECVKETQGKQKSAACSGAHNIRTVFRTINAFNLPKNMVYNIECFTYECIWVSLYYFSKAAPFARFRLLQSRASRGNTYRYCVPILGQGINWKSDFIVLCFVVSWTVMSYCEYRDVVWVRGFRLFILRFTTEVGS